MAEDRIAAHLAVNFLKASRLLTSAKIETPFTGKNCIGSA